MSYVSFVCFPARLPKKFARARKTKTSAGGLRWALSAALALFMTSSCGSSHATLQLQAPAHVVAGVPFSATVTAFYNGHLDTSIDGPIHFTTTDTAALLPTLYVFTAADAGSHTFNLTLVTPGMQSITVSDYIAPIITGSTSVMVSAASPAEQSAASAPPTARPAHQLEEGRWF